MVIKAVIFDCFGVLTEDGWLAFLNKYVREGDREKAHILNRQNDLGQIDYEQFLEQICDLSGAPKEQADTMIRRHHTRNEALLGVMERLKPNYKIGLLSNISGNYLDEFLTPEDLSLFDALSLSGESGHLKPEPSAYTDICDKLGVTPAEAVFFDDREGFVVGATRAGLKAFLYTTVAQLERDLAGIGVTA